MGDREITDHQRLSGLGYCFSAALPPYLATAAMGALDTLESQEGQHLLAKTQQNAGYLRSRLASLTGMSASSCLGYSQEISQKWSLIFKLSPQSRLCKAHLHTSWP